ncbi:polysaccharide biosynthesis tyrosine autokinase [Salinisphaera hydrothermalis]|uniref:polysaccharide biosynthesis tyrosine autokinase n=1 Tax=Salinisphaera hydrothermalis TaxID=563188 RepID=UPI003342857D
MSNDESQTRGESGAADDHEIDLREYLGVLADGWRWIAAGAVIGLLIAAYFAWSAHPQYEATSLMRVKPSGDNMAPEAFMGGAAGALSGGSGGLTHGLVSAEGAILESRSVVSKAVQAKHLEIRVHPVYLPVIGEPIARLHQAVSSGVWSWGGYAWGNEHAEVTRVELPAGVSSARLTLVAESKGQYQLRTPSGETFLTGQVGQSEQASLPGVGVIHIFVRSIHAAPGTRFHVQSLALPSAVASVQARLKAEEKPSGSGLLNLTLTAGSPSAAESQLNAVMSAYLDQSVARESKQAEKRLAFLQKQLPQLRQQRDAAQAKLAQYQSKTGVLDLSTQAQATLDQLTNLDQKIAEVDIDRQQLLQEYTSKAPQVKAANDKKSALEARREKLQKQLKHLPSGESRFLELKRDAEVKDQLYTQMLNTAQSLKVSKAGVTGNTYIVDNAYSNGAMVSPKRLMIQLVGLLLGGVLAALWVITRALLRTTVDEPNEIESRFGVPVYATVPFAPEQKSKRDRTGPDTLLVNSAPNAPAAESLRSFRTSLEFALMEAGTRFIGITGPTPACGKSFISANAAALIAHTGARVLLVDADMRRGSLYRQFGIAQSPGLSEVLAGESDLVTECQSSGVDNLDVLATGKRPPNPAELLLSKRFVDMKAELKERYDYVLFDLPPVLNVTDALIVAHHLPATFMVVRSEHSTMHEVDQALRRFNHDGVKTAGVIFNALNPQRKRYGAGRYGYYGYSY